MYIEICNTISQIIPQSLYIQSFIPQLVNLSKDKIILVRLTLSIFLNKSKNIDWLINNDIIKTIIDTLKNDESNDVKFNIIPLTIPQVPSINDSVLPSIKESSSHELLSPITNKSKDPPIISPCIFYYI